jgi:ubiquinone/menaquinone biosynthesis C-methylase UbiE
VLDVGCGTGLLLRGLVARVPNVLELVGVDPAPRMVTSARAAGAGAVEIVQGVAEELPFPQARSISSSARCPSTTGRTSGAAWRR